MPLGSGEVPADILARLQSYGSPTTAKGSENDDFVTPGSSDGTWHAGRDSNPRPPGSKAASGVRSTL